MKECRVKCNKCSYDVDISNIHKLSRHILLNHRLKLYVCPACPKQGKSFYASNLKLIQDHAEDIHVDCIPLVKTSIVLQDIILEKESAQIELGEPGSLVEKLKSFFSGANIEKTASNQKNNQINSPKRIS